MLLLHGFVNKLILYRLQSEHIFNYIIFSLIKYYQFDLNLFNGGPLIKKQIQRFNILVIHQKYLAYKLATQQFDLQV